MSPPSDADAHDSSEEAIRSHLRTTLSSGSSDLSRLIVDLQRELRQIASARRFGSGAGDTLSTTALVNETYLKLSGSSDAFSGIERDHFLAIAAQAMRYILINHARDKLAQKRGPGTRHETLDDDEPIGNDAEEARRLLELDDVLQHLARIRPRLAQVVQLRFFGGLNETEIGRVLGLDPSSVRRDWVKARGWLSQQLAPE